MPPAPVIPTIKIADCITKFRPAKSFSEHKPGSEVTSLDFDDSGEFCIASCDDESLQLYDCKHGKHSKQLFSKKYGAHLAKFTHHSASVIYASTKENDTIRYLSLHDNSFRRYFVGHTARVNCLEMCPTSDQFLSTSMDNTLRLWDLNSQNFHGLLNVTAPLLATFDPSGLIFAVASPPTLKILLYDLRNYDKAPFATFTLPKNTTTQWSKLEFSNDGRLILLGTRTNSHFVLDAYEGGIVARLLRDHLGPTPPLTPNPNLVGSAKETSGDVCWAPDARFVLGGTGTNHICVWDVGKGVPVEGCLRPMLEHEYPKDGASCVAFNPRNALFATARREVVFWLPELNPGGDTVAKYEG